MAWNDSGNKDPWSKPPKHDGPPDLDDLVKKLQQKLNTVFANKKSAGEGEAGAPKMPRAPKGILFGLVLVVIALIWGLWGIYVVSPTDQAAVLRFGRYVRTTGPGLHWVPPLIESEYKVNVQSISTYPYQAEMLTKDENIVSVAIAVQYRVDNVHDFLFNAINPTQSLQQATASALRQVVGGTTLDEILTTGREQVRESTVKQIRTILKRYHVGIAITDVTILPAKPPEAVTEAFDDVNRAREDEQRYINQAKAYQDKVVPIANGQAARILQEASAYKQQVLLQARANVARYLALLPQYQRDPQLLRKHMYLTTIESVLKHSSKILVDVKGGNNVMYLPLTKLIGQKPSSTPTLAQKVEAKVAKTTLATGQDDQDTTSSRPSRASYSDGGAN